VSLATRALAVLIPAALIGYAGFALATGRWPSGLAAPVVAWLLWRRHRRARFSAYVLLSVVVARAAMTGTWWLAAGALAVLALLQSPAAARIWPRVRPGFARTETSAPDGSDRMSRP
jgi:hypothetical protein